MGDENARRLWNCKYEQGLPSLTKPDPFFTSAYARFVRPTFPEPGVALDLAGGRGRHALWLARRGWRVSVVDISDVALGKLGETAARLKLNVRLVAGDVTDFAFEPNRYDLILLFYQLDRRLFPEMAPALRTDGLVICKLAITWDQDAVAGGTDRPLGRNELQSRLPEFQMLHHSERPVRNRGVAEFVGRKRDERPRSRPGQRAERKGLPGRDPRLPPGGEERFHIFSPFASLQYISSEMYSIWSSFTPLPTY
jgi:hypothetical protein